MKWDWLFQRKERDISEENRKQSGMFCLEKREEAKTAPLLSAHFYITLYHTNVYRIQSQWRSVLVW